MKEYFKEEIKYLDICIKELEEKLKWGNKEEWTNYHFKQLSEEISKITNVTISVSSIRRILGQDKSYKDKFNPQIETKNSLARFLGFASWADFKEKHTLKNSFRYSIPFLSLNPKILISIIGSIILLTILFFFLIPLIKPTIEYFDIRQTTGVAPLTVAVNYDIRKTRKNKYQIHFGEYFHTPKKQDLDKNENIIIHTYYSSYIYKILIYRNNDTIQSQNIIVYSKGWEYGVFNSKRDKYIFLPENLISNKNYLTLKPIDLSKSGIDTTKTYSTEFKNIADFNVDGDNMTYIANVKLNKILQSSGCYDLNFWLLGMNEDLMITFSNKGCAGLAKIKAADFNKDGKFELLNELSHDFFTWKNVKIKTINKKAEIFIDNKLIYSFRYNKTIGEIKGIQMFFTGSAEVKDVQFLNSQQVNVLVHK